MKFRRLTNFILPFPDDISYVNSRQVVWIIKLNETFVQFFFNFEIMLNRCLTRAIPFVDTANLNLSAIFFITRVFPNTETQRD